MATWIKIYDAAPWDDNPAVLGSFDYDRALRFDKPPDPDGDTCGIIHRYCLLRTAGGHWVFEHSVRQPPEKPKVTYHFWSDEEAVRWLLHFKMQNVVEH